MTDTSLAPDSVPAATPAVAIEPALAGAMMRAARQRQGLHIAALAAAIKVSPAKLEALESGRYHELLDATFTRALAQTVCRALKIDPGPVLAQLPGTPADRLGRVDGGLNTPFRERPGRVVPADWAPWRHPVLWGVALLLVAAAAFVLVPSGAVRLGLPLPVPALGDGGAAPLMPPGGALPSAADTAVPVLQVAPAPASAVGQAAPAAVASSPLALATPTHTGASTAQEVMAGGVAGDVVTLRALQSTWVQAVDGGGQTLIARLVPAGETVALPVANSVRLRIGNARGTELNFRGKPVDLASAARENIANITLP